MLKVALLSFSFNILIIIAFSQPIENRFIDALIHDKDNITDYIDKDELNSSSRLGIEYSGVNHGLFRFIFPMKLKKGLKEENITIHCKPSSLKTASVWLPLQ